MRHGDKKKKEKKNADILYCICAYTSGTSKEIHRTLVAKGVGRIICYVNTFILIEARARLMQIAQRLEGEPADRKRDCRCHAFVFLHM